jgi:hypothetical protein
MITRFGEPALCLLLGIGMRSVAPVLGLYLLIAALALLIKGQIVHQRFVNLERDRRDAKLAAEWMADGPGAASEPPEQSFVASVLVPPRSVEQPDGFIMDRVVPSRQPDRELLVCACPNCARRIRVREKHLGRQCSCPACKKAFIVPV